MGRNKGQDMYERLNFLFQAAYLLLRTCPTNLSLICYYGYMIKMVARKTQSKLGSHAKRQICKSCHVLLYPGITSEIRLRSRRSKHRVVKCKVCGEVKRFLSNPDFKLWPDRPQKPRPSKSKPPKSKK